MAIQIERAFCKINLSRDQASDRATPYELQNVSLNTDIYELASPKLLVSGFISSSTSLLLPQVIPPIQKHVVAHRPQAQLEGLIILIIYYNGYKYQLLLPNTILLNIC